MERVLEYFKKWGIRCDQPLEGRKCFYSAQPPLRSGARRATLQRGGYGFVLNALVSSVLFLGIMPCFADYRIWTDLKGNSIEARLLDANPARVSIQDKNGKVYKFPPAKLSEADQTYLKTAFPPEIEIEFSKVQDRRKKDYSYYADVMMSGSVVIIAKRHTEYTKSMKAVLVMVGEDQRDNDLIILDRVEGKFNFINSREFELKGNRFKMHEDRYDNSSGTKYKGFLAVVLDEEDQPIHIKASRKEYEAAHARIAGFETGERCTRDFEPKSRVRSY